MSDTVLSWIRSYLTDRKQFVKLGQHKSSETKLEVGVIQGSVLGPLLFAVYCSLVIDVIASHGIRYHQYADDTQLHLAMRADNTATNLSVLAACTADVKLWFMQNGLQLNPDKSEAVIMGTANQLRAASSLSSVKVAGINLPVGCSQRHQGTRSHSRPEFDVRQAHLSCGAVVQLRRTGDLPHSPSTDYGACTDASLNLFSMNIHVHQKPSSAIFREGMRLGLVYRVRVSFP